MTAWRPTPAERRAADAAAWSVGVGDATPWRDDLRQAALVALWRASEGRDRQHYTWALRIAQGAAIDERRRVLGERRDPRGWLPAADISHDTPDGWLSARQGLARLLGLPAQHRAALSAVLECDTRREVAARLGVDQSRINHLLDGRASRPHVPSVRGALAAAV
jgi:DNA-directed RNA polymerase specialized sigma24 family protein